jgi:hypothetical protein
MRLILVKLFALERSLAVAWDATWDVARSAAWRATWDVAWDVARSAAWDVVKQGKIANATCLSAIDDEGSVIRPDKNADWSKILRRLITFDDEVVKKLGLMNHHFRFFYFLRVHEIFSLLPTKDYEGLITDFYQLLKKTGDLECYNQLFLTDISLEFVETSIPRDVAKIILDYSNLSIHDPDDIVLVHNKLKQ